MINLRLPEQTKLSPKLTVVGVGGAGGNAVNNMIRSNLEGVEFLVCNTDAQALSGSVAERKIQLGAHLTNGLGAGANPEVGRLAAEETLDEFLGHIEGSNMVFITCGMGGGTGTGAAPVIARAARERDILTVGVITKPFHFEGTNRMRLAEAGIAEMQKYVDTLIIIPNQNLFRIANEKTTFADAFRLADEVLQSGVRGVTDLMVMPGLINLDFADIRAVMAEMGKAMMGTGEASGERRAIEAAEAAISNPLLDDVSMKGARGVLINITGGLDMTLFEVDEAANRIRDEVDAEANIIFGSTFDESMEGLMRVSVVATGIETQAAAQPRPAPLSVVSADQQQQAKRSVGIPAGATRPAMPAGSGDLRYTTTGYAAVSPAMMSPSVQNTGGFSASQPVMTSAAAAQAPAPAATQQQPQTGYAAPAAPPPTMTATARKLEDPQHYHQPAARPHPATAQPAAPYTTAPAGSRAIPHPSPRGQRHGGHFIPPKPIEPTLGSAGHTTSLDPFAEADQANGLKAQGERPQARQMETRKNPSLFERFTGQGRYQEENVSAGSQEKYATPPVQPHLSVEPGGKMTGPEEDELDIPAFLRRQAN